MPRQARLDAPGTLHHVMGRGIEGSRVFRSKADRGDFLDRVAGLCQEEAWLVYAWALMPNHFHLLVRSGKSTLSRSMRRLLTGYVINFNLRHKRQGHLFQNRYKSVVCEDDPYLLELTRYIHLNPLRGELVPELEGLSEYPWCGHSALMGKVKREWQETETVLAYFGVRKGEAVRRYGAFVAEGLSQGRRPDLVGGGLIRSLGGWSQVLSVRRKGEKTASDDRILGGGCFVERLLAEADDSARVSLRLSTRIKGLGSLAAEVCEKTGVSDLDLRSGRRTKKVSTARALFCQLAVRKMGYPGAKVARFLGVTTSAVIRAAHTKDLPELKEWK